MQKDEFILSHNISPVTAISSITHVIKEYIRTRFPKGAIKATWVGGGQHTISGLQRKTERDYYASRPLLFLQPNFILEEAEFQKNRFTDPMLEPKENLIIQDIKHMQAIYGNMKDIQSVRMETKRYTLDILYTVFAESPLQISNLKNQIDSAIPNRRKFFLNKIVTPFILPADSVSSLMSDLDLDIKNIDDVKTFLTKFREHSLFSTTINTQGNSGRKELQINYWQNLLVETEKTRAKINRVGKSQDKGYITAGIKVEFDFPHKIFTITHKDPEKPEDYEEGIIVKDYGDNLDGVIILSSRFSTELTPDKLDNKVIVLSLEFQSGNMMLDHLYLARELPEYVATLIKDNYEDEQYMEDNVIIQVKENKYSIDLKKGVDFDYLPTTKVIKLLSAKPDTRYLVNIYIDHKELNKYRNEYLNYQESMDSSLL